MWKSEKFLSHQRNISSNEIQIEKKPVIFTKVLPKMCETKAQKFPHSVHVWKLQNFTAIIFSQKFREINFLLKNFTLSWFDEKYFALAVNFSFFHTVWEIHSHLMEKYFVKSTLLFKKLKTMLSRNFCSKCVRVNFWVFHTMFP